MLLLIVVESNLPERELKLQPSTEVFFKCKSQSNLINRYPGPADFVDDARTVFLNCEEFNEDDSEVSHVTR